MLCGPCLWPYGVALSHAPRLTACAARLPPFSFPCGLVGGCPMHRRGGLGGPGPPAAASPCVALRQSRRKSLRESRESRWHSRSTLRESRSFCPKIIVVYKIPFIKAGFFLPSFPELTESRAKVARFRLILHQSRWLLCTSAGAVRGSSPQSAAGSVSKPSPACPPCRNSSWHGSNRQGNSASRKPQVLRQKSLTVLIE